MSTKATTSSGAVSTYIKRALPHLLDEWAAAHGTTSSRAVIDGRLRYFIDDVMLTPDELLDFMDHQHLPSGSPAQLDH